MPPSPGIWLVSYKKAAGERHLSYDDIVCEALCWGWIDSKARSLDELRSQLLLTPRKPASKWSRPNKIRVAELEASGRMAAPGRAVVEAAKASGTWTALDDVENLVEPAELKAALDATPGGPAELGRLPALDPAGHPGVDRRGEAPGNARAPDHRDRRPGRPERPPNLALSALGTAMATTQLTSRLTGWRRG